MSNIHKNFNSRTRVGATPGGCGAGIFTRFQFTHPCGCDQPYAGVWGNPDVSIHAPVWVRPGPYSHHKTHKGFNSRTRVGATAVPTPSRRARTGFNSRTRVGATRPQDGRCFVRTVSIHAPVWVRRGAAESRRLHIPSFNSRTRVGATPSLPASKTSRGVSIHAPVWVRLYGTYSKQGANRFQFTHPCGCDLAAIKSNFEAMVSIHAPVWVRPVSWGMHMYSSKFQFTHPCGCDSALRSCPHYGTKFQFTHPCGCDAGPPKAGDSIYRVSIHAPVWVRLCIYLSPLPASSFNSRTRVGATDGKIDSLLTSLVSIHAPVWVRHYTMALRETFNGFNSRTRVGATCKNHDKVHNDDVSIHAPVWVRQVRDQTTTQSKTVSIHAPVWVRLESYRARQSSLKFQFTHPCGCDNPARTPRPRRPSFNSRTRVGATS